LWQHRPVRIRAALLALSIVAGAVYVAGVLLVTEPVAGQAAAVAFAGLSAYVLLSRRVAAARIWLPVVLGVLAIGIGVLVEIDWRGRTAEFGWFSYEPLSQAPSVGQDWADALEPHHRLAIGLLAGALALGVGVFLSEQPAQPARAGWLAVPLVVVLVAAGFVGTAAWHVASQQSTKGSPLLSMVAGAWVPLLTVAVLTAVAVVAMRRVERGGLVAAGAVLVAVVTLNLIGDALAWMPMPDPPEDPFLDHPAQVILAPQLVDSGSDPVGAISAAALFGGVLLATLGLMARQRQP
jgi:hypothetical protein